MPTREDVEQVRRCVLIMRGHWWRGVLMLVCAVLMLLWCAYVMVTEAWAGNATGCLLNAVAAGVNQHAVMFGLMHLRNITASIAHAIETVRIGEELLRGAEAEAQDK